MVPTNCIKNAQSVNLTQLTQVVENRREICGFVIIILLYVNFAFAHFCQAIKSR